MHRARADALHRTVIGYCGHSGGMKHAEMYLIEWIGLPARRPKVLRTAPVDVVSVEVAMAQAEAELITIREGEPDAAGYRISRPGNRPLITRWIDR